METMIWDPFANMLWSAAITIIFICTLQWISFGRKKEKIEEKRIIYGFASMTFFYGLGLLFWMLSEFYIKGVYVNNAFYGDFNSFTSTYRILNRVGSIFVSIGAISFILTFEMYYKRTKYILTTLTTSILAIQAIAPWEIFQFIQNYIIMPLLTPLVILILLLYTKWALHELKAISSNLLFGLLILMIGLFLNNPNIRVSNAVPLIISPIITIIGFLITISPTLVDPMHFSRVRIYWLSSGILIIAICWIILFFIIAVNIPAGHIFIGYLILIIAAMIMLFYSMKIIKEKDENSNILEVFLRPSKVTEEEVTVSKEKKVCLVCKGKVVGFNIFICKCDVLYCEKCALTLSDLENMCWVCETPFDNTKPTKPFQKEQKEAIEVEKNNKGKVEEEILKKGEEK